MPGSVVGWPTSVGGCPRWVTLLSLRFVCNLQSLWQRGSLLKQTEKNIIKKIVGRGIYAFLG